MPDTDQLPNNLKSTPKYLPIEQIIALRKKNLSSNQIAAILGCSGSNIRIRLSKINDDLVNTEHYKDNRATIFQYNQRKIIQSITDADLKKANLRDKVIAAGILYDKERLETGQSTQNIAYCDMIRAKANAADNLQVIEAQLVEAGVDLDQVK